MTTISKTQAKNTNQRPASSTSGASGTATVKKAAGARAKKAALGDATNTNQDVAALTVELKKLKASYSLLQKQVAKSAEVKPTIPRPVCGVAGQDYNLQEEMKLTENKDLYAAIRRSVRTTVVAAGLDYKLPWKHQPKDKICQIIAITRARHEYLKNFVNTWPVEELIKSNLKNRRAYARKHGFDMTTTVTQSDDGDQDMGTNPSDGAGANGGDTNPEDGDNDEEAEEGEGDEMVQE